MTSTFLRDRRLPFLLAAVAVAVFALFGVRALGGGSAAPASSDPASRVSAVTATALDGTRVSVPATGAPTAAYFFSASCGSCIDGARALVRAHSSTGSEVALVLVDIDPYDRPEDIRAFLAAAGATDATTVRDTGGALTRGFGVSALSTAVVFDRDGQIVFRGIEPTPDQAATALANAAAG